MKISLNWIKDFVELDPTISATKLVETITLSVCEVEGHEETGTHLKDIVVAEVLGKEQHPNADKLSLVTITTGKETHKIVCGATNYKVGDKVAYAGLGVVLPGDFKIKKAKIRGVESLGMLCGEDELGLSDDHSGLLLLPQETEIGSTLDQLYPDQIDLVMEIDNKSITHRPDLWGHYGFARELATIYGKKLKPMDEHLPFLKSEGEGLVQLEVKGGELVPRFTGLSVSNVAVVPSPIWMQHRLYRVGLRAINNLVDITNYIMLEYGQPMHAFDINQIGGQQLLVKPGVEGEKLLTLYDKEVDLTPNDLVIYDANGPATVAGIIGGMNTGVNDETNAIFFEAANWDSVTVRKTSTRIGIRTDALQRFEKSLDPSMTEYAINRAVELLKLTCPELKVTGNAIDIWGKKLNKIEIELDLDFLTRRLGKEIAEQEVEEILTGLEFVITRREGRLITVKVPSHRSTKDVSIREDLVEEVGRIHGFNNIIPSAPAFPIERPAFNHHRLYENNCKKVLSDSGYNELYLYPLTCAEDEKLFRAASDEAVMKLLNPVAENQNEMRTSLLPHFTKAIHENQKSFSDFKIFEQGRVYLKNTEGEITEENQVVLAVSKSEGKLGDAFYQLKADLVKLFSHLQCPKISFKSVAKENLEAYQHPYIAAEIYSKREKIGTIFSLTPAYRSQLGINHDVCLAVLEFDLMFNLGKEEFKFKPINKYPAVLFDLSVMVPTRTLFQEIHDLILKQDQLITKVDFTDLYFPKDSEEKSMTVSIKFQSEAKTLDSEEIKTLQDKIMEAVIQNGYQIR